MDIASLTGIQSSYLEQFAEDRKITKTEDESFQSVLSSMMDALNETDELQHTAESEEIRFALGESENTHDLMIAETKASVALQYTVAVMSI